MEQSPFLLDSLFCQEEYDCFSEEGELQSFYKIGDNLSTPSSNPDPQLFLEQDLLWEDDELISLLSKETENRLYDELEKNPSLAESRREAVDWILNIAAHYSFSHLTAVLAVNYLDRFLCSSQLNREKPWMTQLAAVACLSLAAKVEETQVPLLGDLQVEETRYVFEAKTIQRMEVLVLSTLQWRMNPVTATSFVDHFVRRLGFKDHLCFQFLKRCEGLIASTISDSRFLRFLPSVLATATMRHVVNAMNPCFEAEYQNQLFSALKIDKEEVDDCYELILDSASGFSGSRHKSNKRKLRSSPGSPNGVIDICFSSDSSNDSWTVATPASAAASVSSSPEPLSKRIRVQCHEAEDDIPSISL